MASHSPFELPNELLISSLIGQYSCREGQIRTLATLLSSYFHPPRNIVLYGLKATGKSAVATSVLSALCTQDRSTSTHDYESYKEFKFAIVQSSECITGRHLLESTVGAIATAVDWKGSMGRCETLAQLAVEASRLIEAYHEKNDKHSADPSDRSRFVLVFDGVDRQRDAPLTLLQGLARMAEIIPNLTVIFIVTSPRPHFLHTSSVPYLHFPAYSKSEAVSILSRKVPSIYTTVGDESPDPKEQKEISDLWSRFVSAVWDSLAKHSGRDILSLRAICARLWSPFTSLIRDGTYTPKDFTRLLVAKRSLFQDERLLVPSITSALSPATTTAASNITLPQLKRDTRLNPTTNPGITTQLPLTPRLILIAAYLASYTPSRKDISLFSKSSIFAKKRRRKTGTTTASHSQNVTSKTGVKTRHRKISRTLLGPQAFVLERLLAIFAAIRSEASLGKAYFAGGMTADVPMAIATLSSLRLLIRTGGAGDPLEAGTKYRVNVGWEVVRSVARSVGVEVEDFIVE